MRSPKTHLQERHPDTSKRSGPATRNSTSEPEESEWTKRPTTPEGRKASPSSTQELHLATNLRSGCRCRPAGVWWPQLSCGGGELRAPFPHLARLDPDELQGQLLPHSRRKKIKAKTKPTRKSVQKARKESVNLAFKNAGSGSPPCCASVPGGRRRWCSSGRHQTLPSGRCGDLGRFEPPSRCMESASYVSPSDVAKYSLLIEACLVEAPVRVPGTLHDLRPEKLHHLEHELTNDGPLLYSKWIGSLGPSVH